MLTRIVYPSPALESFLSSLRLALSQPQRDHLHQLVDGLLVCDESKTLAALQRQFLDSTDPSNWADFLRISPWCAQDVRTALRCHQVEWLVAEAQRRVRDQVSLPKGRYRLEFGGQFEHLIRARQRLLVIVPVALSIATMAWQVRRFEKSCVPVTERPEAAGV